MKINSRFIALVAGVAAVACSPAAKMAEMYENVKVTCNPEVLEVVADEINAVVSVSYPDGYFHPKAMLAVTPVIVFEDGEAQMRTLTYQGEKVKDNYRVVPTTGGTVNERVHFDYVDGMESAYLELRGEIIYKGVSYAVPAKKVADGSNITYKLVEFGCEGGSPATVSYKADNYQEIIKQTEEGQIMYSINSSNVASNQLKSQSIKDFQAALDEIKANERKTLTGTEVIAYASPEGGAKLNDKLSDSRSKSADKAFSQVTKGKDTAETSVKSMGQDWEGFQDLVSKSDIEDKDLILRVLNMYSDPAVRESEIKNISEVYTSLKKSVLPDLRRARFIANVEYQNYTAEELMKLINDNIDVLDEEALLRAATLVNETNKKVSIYEKAIDKYNSDRAQFNLGVAYLNNGQLAKAERAFKAVKTQDADLENALGAIALANGDKETASKHFKKAATEEAMANQAVVDILSGNYDAAAKALAGKEGFNAALAQVLVDNLPAATKALTCQCPKANYLRAIIAARQGNAQGVQDNLKKAGEDKKLAARAAKDIEFAMYR